MVIASSITVRHPEQRTGTLLRLIPWAILAMGCAAGLAGLDGSGRLAPWPFLLSAVFLGLPHGAVDLWLSGRRDGRQDLGLTLRRFTLYLVMMAGMVLIVLAAPRWSMLVFAAATAWHFGAADRRDAVRLTAAITNDRRGGGRLSAVDHVAACGRGSMLLAFAFVFHPAPTMLVLNGVLDVVGGAPLDGAGAQRVGIAAACVGLVAWLGASVAGWHRRGPSLIGIEAFELMVIAATFALLHPAFAMGLYFLCWHSLRHMVTLAEATTPADRPWLARLAHLHVVSLPLLVPTLGVLAAMAWLLGVGGDAGSLMLLLLVVFIIVTPSHHLLVERVVPRLLRDPPAGS